MNENYMFMYIFTHDVLRPIQEILNIFMYLFATLPLSLVHCS